MNALRKLALERIERLGGPVFGPYLLGRYDAASRCKNGEEELADSYAYNVIFDELERPGPSRARDLVARCLELTYAALQHQKAEALQEQLEGITATNRRAAVRRGSSARGAAGRARGTRAA